MPAPVVALMCLCFLVNCQGALETKPLGLGLVLSGQHRWPVHLADLSLPVYPRWPLCAVTQSPQICCELVLFTTQMPCSVIACMF